jgi:DNA-binding GntR family transcriptional regulator
MDPKYQQLADILRGQIQSGELEPRRMVPSRATLYQRYGVSQPTVAHAVKILVAEGLIVYMKGRGYFVTEPGSRPTAGA